MIPIEVTNLTKRFGQDLAVDGVTFSVRPGEVTGFLGRNGAGKSTTLRMILGLERPTAGIATIDGQPYAKLRTPLRHVGSLLDARAVQPGSNATDHLLALAHSNRIDRTRVGEVLDTVGLSKVGGKKAGTFSLGMLQRLGLAAALLGDPPILVLDEPLNGLDPEGIIWFRDLMRSLAAEGRTVLLSSHLMTEMSVTADHLLIIGEGRLLLDSEMAAFQHEYEHEEIRVRTADPRTLRGRIIDAGATIRDLDAAAIAVTGLDGPTIGALALKAGVELYELAPVRRSLEEAFMELTTPSVPESARPILVTHTAMEPVRSENPRTAAPEPSGPRFRDIVRSELTKFRSTLTRPIIVVASILASAGSAILFANATASAYKDFDKADLDSFDPTNTSLRGRSIMSVTLGMLGALALTSEHSSGSIDPSLAAVPDRTKLFVAKAVTTAGISLATGLVANTASFLVGQAMFARRGTPHDTFRSKGSARAVLGGSLHWTLSALLGLATGSLTRSSAATVSTIVGAELLVPGIAPAFPKPLPDILTKYWITEAGASIFATRPNSRVLSPWIGLGVMAASTVAVLGVALATFQRRDV